METQVSNNIESLFERAGEYLETRVDLYQLKAVDKTSDILSTVISKMIVLLVFTMFIFIINIGIALYLGELLGRAYYGFFVLAGFYLIAGLVFKSYRKKWLKEPLTDKLIRQFLK
jgi:hypothetical protein